MLSSFVCAGLLWEQTAEFRGSSGRPSGSLVADDAREYGTNILKLDEPNLFSGDNTHHKRLVLLRRQRYSHPHTARPLQQRLHQPDQRLPLGHFSAHHRRSHLQNFVRHQV